MKEEIAQNVEVLIRKYEKEKGELQEIIEKAKEREEQYRVVIEQLENK
jgi:hypothetical protein